MIEKVAENLEEVYANFDPLVPLLGDSKFYVDRKNNPLKRMRRELLRDSRPDGRTPQKYLFSGHRGSGKSTELNTLMVDQEIQRKYFVVHYSVRDILDIAGLDYTDLLFSIGAQIFTKATEGGWKLRKKLLDEVNKWIGVTEIKRKVVSQEDASLETQAGLSAFFIKALGKLRVEYTSREEIRQTIKLRLSELISIIDLIITEAEFKIGRKILVAIEDLDKPDLSDARDLFCERQTSLTLPKCSIIYTIPIALIYSPDAGQLRHTFGSPLMLPSVTITKNDDDRSPNDKGRDVMREFVTKRMSPGLIEPDALEHAITISGGVFREMARIIRDAADNAIANGKKKIEKTYVETAESEIRNEFRRMLRIGDYDELKEIYKTRELKVSKERAELLHNLSILEYQNKENWCDVHPAVVPLIKG